MEMQGLGKFLIAFGLIGAAVGNALMVSDKIQFLGNLPGDNHIKRENVRVYLPLTTEIVISALISIVLWLISNFRGR